MAVVEAEVAAVAGARWKRATPPPWVAVVAEEAGVVEVVAAAREWRACRAGPR